MSRYEASINYTMKATHPDINCVRDWTPSKVFHYSDTYTFDDDVYPEEEDRRDFMRHDMALVAGGGYNTDHIEIIRCEYTRK